MSDAFETAVRRDLEQLVHDLGMLLAHETGGTTYTNRQLAAQYLIDLFDAADDGETVTAHLLAGVKAYKEIRMAMQDLGVDR